MTLLSRVVSHLLREGAGIVAPVQEKGSGIVAPVQEKKGGGDDIRKTLWVLDDQRPQVLSEKTDHSANGDEYVVSCN